MEIILEYLKNNPKYNLNYEPFYFSGDHNIPEKDRCVWRIVEYYTYDRCCEEEYIYTASTLELLADIIKTDMAS